MIVRNAIDHAGVDNPSVICFANATSLYTREALAGASWGVILIVGADAHIGPSHTAYGMGNENRAKPNPPHLRCGRRAPPGTGVLNGPCPMGKPDASRCLCNPPVL